jgi:SagB-type dehydrogenase family enzyme
MEREIRDRHRSFLKETIRKAIDYSQTDQSRGVEMPALEKPYKPGAIIIDLAAPGDWQGLEAVDLKAAIGRRMSRRLYSGEPLSLDELSFLLWATQGVRENAGSGRTYRTVPSAGCRHALETYLAVFRIQGLDQGIYRYLPTSHRLLMEFTPGNLKQEIIEATFGQSFAGKAAATFIWTTIPYRMEWRYGLASHKAIALDAGHVCQNLYLACEAIGAGTCAIAAYDQEKADQLLRVDGEEEFVVYMAPVGKIKPEGGNI